MGRNSKPEARGETEAPQESAGLNVRTTQNRGCETLGRVPAGTWTSTPHTGRPGRLERVRCPYGAKYCSGYRCDVRIKGRCDIPDDYARLRDRLREVRCETLVLIENYIDKFVGEEKFNEESGRLNAERSRLERELERYRELMKHSGVGNGRDG
jgi:hypothetical protein